MKLFLFRLVALLLAVAAGFLSWQNTALLRRNAALRETVMQLESERRALEQRLATPAIEKPEERAELRRAIEQQTSELRGLSFQHPVTYKSISRAELRAVLVEKIREQYTEEQARDYGRSFEALGVIPPGTDLMKLWLSLYDEQVGAFYVPEERALYTFKDMSLSGGLDRMILAHELTHALQDQNYDLTKLPLHQKENDDLALATSALLEGDATILMTEFYGRHAAQGSMLGDLLAMLTGQKTEKLQAAPAFIREMLVFPYQTGQQFALALSLRGGNEELNRALANPPISTEQILHPEKYYGERDEPVAVSGADLRAPGWRRIGSNVLGEFGIRGMLQAQLRPAEAQAAAAGWGGDRYQVYERGAGGPLGLYWRTVWDTEQDAAEFVEAFGRYAQKRGVPARVERAGLRITIWLSEDESFRQLAEEGAAGAID